MDWFNSCTGFAGRVCLHPAALVAVGCAVGGNLRYWLAKGVNARPWAEGLPWATFLINVSGSFLLGIAAELYIERTTSDTRREIYLLLGTGFCGGYTTFSTFSYEMLKLMREGHWDWAVIYALGSVIVSLLGVWLGMHLTLMCSPRPPIS